MAEDEEGELPSVDHGPLNEGPWENTVKYTICHAAFQTLPICIPTCIKDQDNYQKANKTEICKCIYLNEDDS